MIRRPPRSTRTDTLFPYTTLFRSLGFKIGLHSGGTHPERLKSVLPLVDWVGFDVKALFANYARVTKVANSGEPALKGLQAILDSGVDYECRTTLHPALLPEHGVLQLARSLEIGSAACRERWCRNGERSG